MNSITSAHNSILKHIAALVRNKAMRQEQQRVVVTGENLIKDLAATHSFRRVFVDRLDRLPGGLKPDELYQVPPEVLEKVCGVPTIAAELDLPPPGDISKSARLLVLDGVSDPGNLGTLLRTAQAFGWDGVYFLDGCCDLFNDKALRAAKGATFHLPYAHGSWQEIREMGRWQSLVAHVSGQSAEAVVLTGPILLVLGSEAHGVRPEVLDEGETITLPIASEVDSLNVAVAGGVLMYLLGPGARK